MYQSSWGNRATKKNPQIVSSAPIVLRMINDGERKLVIPRDFVAEFIAVKYADVAQTIKDGDIQPLANND